MTATKHDHIVTIYQVDRDRGVPFLAMEFLEGESLEQRLKRREQMPLTETLRIGRQIALALTAAHKRGLIHRDVKPGNIWLESGTGRVKILDFGLARAVGNESNLTQEGAIAGTPAYMAPEQARGETVDPRGDLFSLGCVLYRMMTGKAPFESRDAMSTLAALALPHLPAPRDLNAEVPQALNNLIPRLLAKNVPDRPSSAEAVVTALEAIERSPADTIVYAAPVEIPVSRKRKRRLWVVVAAAVACVAAILLAQIIIKTRYKDGREETIEREGVDRVTIVPIPKEQAHLLVRIRGRVPQSLSARQTLGLRGRYPHQRIPRLESTEHP